ncbi:MAG: hypothetical protein LQ340_006666 [Diploschistes diacapsis]|nr:MAG: hypothetical protein LQ340_006666 [Diploschistes diacapsis]
MTVTITHLNGGMGRSSNLARGSILLTILLDTTFLATFSSPDPALTQYQKKLSQVTILIDPWIKGSSTIFHRFLAQSKRTVPASIRHLSEIQPAPQIILVSQDKPDHCNEETLKQLPQDLPGVVIIAQASAAKKIKGWKYFDERKIWSFKDYSPKRSNALYDLQVPFDPNAKTVVELGQLTLAFMAPKLDITGVHNAIGITYRSPVFTNTDESQFGSGVLLNPILNPPTHFPALLPTPPDSPDGMAPVMFEDVPYSPQLPHPPYPYNREDAPSPPLSSYQAPPISDETEFHALKSQKSASSVRDVCNRVTRIMTKSTPDLRGAARFHRKSKTSTSTSTQAASRDSGQTGPWITHPSAARSPYTASRNHHPLENGQIQSNNVSAFNFGQLTPITPIHTSFSTCHHSSSQSSSNRDPSSPMSISPPVPRPQTTQTGDSRNHHRTVSVLYSPHGVQCSTVLPWAQSHLVRHCALPLTLLLHPLTRIQNVWILGGNIQTGWRGGLEIAQNLMARCWIAAHDEVKEDSGALVKTVKREEAKREALEKILGGGGPSYAKKKRGCEVVDLGVGDSWRIHGDAGKDLKGWRGQYASLEV